MRKTRESKELTPFGSNVAAGLDEYRWLRARQHNIPVDQIAAQDGVSPLAVERSINKVDRKRARMTLREVHATEMGVLLSGVKAEVEAINGALRANKRVQVLDVRGRPLVEDGHPIYQEVPDHEARLAAVRTRTEILSAIQTKGGGFNVSVNQQTVVNPQVSRRGVEARIIEFNTAREKGLIEGGVQGSAEQEADEQ